VTKNINYYVEGRVFEWVMGLSMAIVGLEIIVWPNAIDASAFRELNLVISERILTFLLLLIGWSRCSALMLNGQRLMGVKLGPYIRAACSIASAMIWMQFAIALAELSIFQGQPSPGIPFWTLFTAGELYAAYTTLKNG
jgi:hypothetical protein